MASMAGISPPLQPAAFPASIKSRHVASVAYQGGQSLHFSFQPPCFQYLQQSKRFVRLRPIRSEDSATEKAFQTTVELDKFIDELREADHRKLPELVAKNVLSFDTSFWMRLAIRADLCRSVDDKRDYQELATSIMTLVERVVRKTEEKIESSTDVLKSILKPISQQDEEILWPPRDLSQIDDMKKELKLKEQQGFLDESFLAEVNAQIRQATEDGDKPGLVAILQKVLQLYAVQMLSKRSYAVKGDGRVDKAEEFLETVISAEEERWADLLRDGIIYGGGVIEPAELYKVINKRIERVTMRTESGSYQQRILVEYLKEIEDRARALEQSFQNPSV